MPKKIYDDEKLRAKALELRKKGYSYREIARELGCSVYKVHELISPYESVQSRLKQAAELGERLNKIAASISELSAKLENLKSVKNLSDRLLKLEETVKSLRKDVEQLNARLSSVLDAIDLIELNARWKRDNCRYYRGDGYCYNWYWSKKVERWKMKKDVVDGKTVYRLNVKEHVMHCANCPSFERRM